jgi:hypothetical protein
VGLVHFKINHDSLALQFTIHSHSVHYIASVRDMEFHNETAELTASQFFVCIIQNVDRYLQ